MAYNTPPAGPAGGDLNGSTYPNPVVVSIGGKSFTLSGALALSGAFSTTITVTGTTNITLPTTGTLATLGNNLGQFSATTSAQLASVLSDETGTGLVVFNTAPTLSGTVAGTYTLGGTPTLAGGTLSGTTTLPGSGQISSTGNLGLGMTPVNVLDITKNVNAGAIGSILNPNVGAASYSNFLLGNATHSAGIALFGTGFTTSGVSRQDGLFIFSPGAGGITLSTTAVQPIYFGINSAQVAEFATTGALLINTAVDDGVNKLQVSGGIKGTNLTFGGSTMSTYTEGTWTPVLAFGGASVGITYTTQTGRYIQIGKQVTVQFSITLTSKGSSTGAATITGLPVATGVNGASVALGSYAGVSLTGALVASVGASASTITLAQFSSSGTVGTADTNFLNAATINGTLTYLLN